MSLDTDYAQADFIPGGADYPERWAAEGRAFRESQAAIGRARLNAAYGAGARHRFDLFHPSGPASGLVVFVHGGYWLRFDRSFWSHFSSGLTDRGWAVAMPSYPLAPDARVAQITAEIATALRTASELVPGPVRLAGHSAGGHLVARMACSDAALAGELRGRIARIVPISPVSDLRPLLGTAMNETLGLDTGEAVAESPVLHAPPDIPVTVWVGAEERPVFLDQALRLAQAWDAGYRIDPGRHHFDVIDGLKDPESPLVAAILA